jgi:hypothetical protein
VVQEVARTLREVLLAHLFAGPAALEQVLDRLERLVRQRYDEVGPDEDVELTGVEPADLLVEHGKVQDDEEVVRILIELRALVARHHVFQVERVEVVVLGEPGALEHRGLDNLQPPQAGVLDLGYLRLGALDLRCNDAATIGPGPSQSGTGNNRHGMALR